jgi:arginyl-tRNA synthetase
MKSREGTVTADADNARNDNTAQKNSRGFRRIDVIRRKKGLNLYSTIGLGRYYILKVDLRNESFFNPEESIDFAGNTGPFIQYTMHVFSL